MRPLGFAWMSLRRQPARALLGVLGVAAVGALLFDMLLLSRGLIVSLRDLLDRVGFDVRVMATDALPAARQELPHALEIAARIATLPEVGAVVPLRLGSAELLSAQGDQPRKSIALVGADAAGRSPWTIVAGREIDRIGGGGATALLVNRNFASALGLGPSATLVLRGTCGGRDEARPPATFVVTGIAEFPFESSGQWAAAATLSGYERLCGSTGRGEADILLVASRAPAGPEGAVAAIRREFPGLNTFTNEEVVSRFQQNDFAYFQQISAVLGTVTTFFGFLLITVLLTVSVNQRLGEIAALRALGFSRWRVVTDVLYESTILVGLGGLLAVPLGAGLSLWLDAILQSMPGLPVGVRFFVFEPRALAWHTILLAATALGAALYPMQIVARLPIAATLRRETIS